ncbi:MAG TPA: hypothetical protein VF843_09235 [Streptosporangiaceae bacterium]
MDKFETGLRFVLVLTFVFGAALLAPATGRLATTAGLRQIRQESSWREVSAVLLQPPPPQFYGYGSMSTYWVPGRWRAPSGTVRSGMIPVRSGIPAGGRVSIWVDQSGAQTGRHPMTTAMVRMRSMLVELGTVAGLGLVLCALAGLAAAALNRRRMIAWGIDWACFGPRWTTRRWPRS